MVEPVSWVLAVQLVKLGLRAAGWNDSADGDGWAGVVAWRRLRSSAGAQGEVATALAARLDRELLQVAPGQRGELKAVVGRVADVVAGFSDADIKAAARNPEEFGRYLVSGPGRPLLEMTEERTAGFTLEVLRVAAVEFARIAPHSPRFVGPALVELLAAAGRQEGATAEVRAELAAVGESLSLRLDTLAAAVDAVPGRVVDEMVARGLGGGSGGRVDPVAASVRAAREGRVVGRPVWQWGAGELGVHAAIEVAAAEGVVPYVRRAHDEDLAAAITGVAGSGRPGVVVVEGTSCAGKSRALFEAITGDPAVRQWQLVVPGEPAPPDPAVLGDVVAAGVSAGTVIWLDELQRWLPRTKQALLT